MKKLLLFLFFISLLHAKEQVYLGLNYSYMQENFTTHDAKNQTNNINLKIGYGDLKAYAIEFSIEYMPNNSKIFSAPSTNKKDGDKLGFNISLLKSFNLTSYLYPFARIGFGTGYMDIARELQNSLSYGSFNMGAGVFIPIHENFDIELAYEYRSTSYEVIDTIVNKISHSSNANKFTLGFNLRF